MKVALQPVDDAHPFPHELFAPPRETFEMIVGNRCRGNFMQRVFRQGQVLGQTEQFENSARINRVGLGRCRKDFLVAGKFEVVDAVQAVAVAEDVPV